MLGLVGGAAGGAFAGVDLRLRLRLVTSQGSPYPSRSPRAYPSGWTRIPSVFLDASSVGGTYKPTAIARPPPCTAVVGVTSPLLLRSETAQIARGIADTEPSEEIYS